MKWKIFHIADNAFHSILKIFDLGIFVELIYKINKTYANEYDIQKEIRTVLFNTFVSEKHVDYIKEDDFYNAIEALGITGIELLGVNLKYNDSNVSYIEIPSSRIPELTNVIFTPVSQE